MFSFFKPSKPPFLRYHLPSKFTTKNNNWWRVTGQSIPTNSYVEEWCKENLNGKYWVDSISVIVEDESDFVLLTMGFADE